MNRSGILLGSSALLAAFVAGYVVAGTGGRGSSSDELPADLRRARTDPGAARGSDRTGNDSAESSAPRTSTDMGSEQASVAPAERWMTPVDVSGWFGAAGASGFAGMGGMGGFAGAAAEPLASYAGMAGMPPLMSGAEGGAAPAEPSPPPPSASAVAEAEARLYGAGPGYTGVSAGWSGFTGAGAGDFGYTGIGAGDSGFTGHGAGKGFTGIGAGDSGYTGIGAGKGFTGTGAAPVPSVAPPIVTWPAPSASR